MTNLWKRIAAGVAVVGGVAVATYFWMPVRLAAASMMSGDMMSGMMNGNMSAMMANHMKDGNMSAMMESHMKDGNMSAMMESHMKDGNMSAMMEMMGSDMMANMDKIHEAMAPMHQKELEAAAGVLGITVDDLTKALADGKDADSIAKERNVDPALLTSALAAVRTTAFADLVAAGTLTQEQADKMLEHMTQAGNATLGMATAMQGASCHSQTAPTN